MGNMKQKISRHNSKIQQSEEERSSDFGCNFTAAIGLCPLGGNCLVNSVVYGAEVVSDNSNKQTYTGLTRTTFKKCFYGHRHSFRIENKNIQPHFPPMCGSNKITTKIST